MAAAVATHSHHRISKRLHIADVKNLIGDDQAVRSIEIPQFRFVYVYTIATDALAAAQWLQAASLDRSNEPNERKKTSPG